MTEQERENALEQAVDAIYRDIRESFALALAGAIDDNIAKSVLATVDDSVANHFDDLVAHFDSTEPA